MRRMLTEKDVDKIDSIDPADIETLKATASPKDANSGYVLTADGKGKATYKAVPESKTKFHTQFGIMSSEGYSTDEFGNKYIYTSIGYNNTMLNGYLRNSLKAGDANIPIAELTAMLWRDGIGNKGDQLRVYLSDEIITKYSITNTTTLSVWYATISIEGKRL